MNGSDHWAKTPCGQGACNISLLTSLSYNKSHPKLKLHVVVLSLAMYISRSPKKIVSSRFWKDEMVQAGIFTATSYFLSFFETRLILRLRGMRYCGGVSWDFWGVRKIPQSGGEEAGFDENFFDFVDGVGILSVKERFWKTQEYDNSMRFCWARLCEKA